MVFEHVVAALVHGSGYERIASPGCSDRTIRRRLAEWADLGIAEALHAAALRAYDQIIGLELGDVAVDGCLTKAPCGGERAGPSPVDRRKGQQRAGVDGTSIWSARNHGPGRGPHRSAHERPAAITGGNQTPLGGCPTVGCPTICVDSESAWPKDLLRPCAPGRAGEGQCRVAAKPLGG